MKKLILLILLIFPLFLSAQDLLGKKKKYIASVKQNSTLLVDLPEMTVWSNKADAGSLFLICYFQDDKCDKTISIYPNEKLKQWEKILSSNCVKVKGEKDAWLDQKRQLLFKILPGDNDTFGLETTKANVQ